MRQTPRLIVGMTGILCGLTATLSGCHIEKPYQRPTIALAPAYRDGDAAQATAEGKGIADEKWWQVFDDPQLVALIHTAIAQNYDARIAAERVTQASAQVGVTRADQLPSLNGTASWNSQQYAKGQMGTNPNPVMANMGGLGASAVWNLDFWGRYRLATKAARAQLLSAEWARRAVIDTVVADVASGYFQLRTMDMQLEIAQKTLESRKESLQLTQALEKQGADSMLDVREAEQLVLAAQTQITDLERQIEQQEDVLCTLLGEMPHAIQRGASIDRQPAAPTIPTGLPSELLERRPDIKEAEALLIAANAQIGIARSAYFPQISLTGSTGTDSNALSRLFTGSSHVWNYGPSMSVPIFDAGKIKNNIKVTESEQRQAVLVYQQNIANAFRDVSKALVAYRKYREYRDQQQKIVEAAEDALRFSRIRYEHGQSSYMDVLTNDRTTLTARLELATAKQNELLSLVQLYEALGGGWQN